MRSIGRYQVRAALGQGAMGKVYKVLVPRIEKIMAAKVLDPGPKLTDAMGMENLRKVFLREAAMIANLRHPHVVEIWGLEEDAGKPFYVMEYFSRNLGSLIGESYWADAPTRVMPLQKAAGYVTQVLRGLARLHHAGIIHRDIKPFNIMLTDDGTARIVDFGLSRRRGEVPVSTGQAAAGTPFYTAPEQADAPDAADHRADLYSAGVLLYRLITGRLPRATPESPSRLNPDLDPAWDNLVQTSIHPDPAGRFQDAVGMADALQAVLAQYREKKEAECRAAADFGEAGDPDPAVAAAPVRSQPGRVLAKQGRAVFQVDDLYRPKTYFPNRFEESRPDCVVDHAAGLIWQQSGSEYPLSREQAGAYVRQMNVRQVHNRSRWRLPTVNELLSLLRPPELNEDFCVPSLFSGIQKWVWSGDSRSRRAAWLVDLEMGFVMSGDILDRYYVRAVCRL